MAAPKTTTWSLEPHTKAKHEILKRYLHAWTAILGSGKFPLILYVDGFSGPGRYANGEDGSPAIALRAALAHGQRIKSKVRFQFIEENAERAAMLEQVISEIDRPDSFAVRITNGTFEAGMKEILGWCKANRQSLPSTFAFVDPFGWTGAPFALVQEILSHPSCEVMINFMYEETNRFLSHRDQDENFDQLFGTDDWKPLVQIKKATERRQAIHALYQKQLQSVAKFVRSFEMRNEKDATDYFLFFATNNATGHKKMKEAMWTVDQSGEFTFSDATNPGQALLFGKPNLAALRAEIVRKFAGITTTVGAVERFVLEETAFRETHHKGVLKELELASPPGLIVVNPPSTRKKGTFANPALQLRFAPSSPVVSDQDGHHIG